MNTEEIDALITDYTVKLVKTQLALRPRGSLPYSKFVLYNVAKKNEVKYKDGLLTLRILKLHPEKVTNEMLRELK